MDNRLIEHRLRGILNSAKVDARFVDALLTRGFLAQVPRAFRSFTRLLIDALVFVCIVIMSLFDLVLANLTVLTVLILVYFVLKILIYLF
ncbi:ORF107 [Saltwater crocodilepox virus]|nr:ORF107 [Saltwater crocodilepox virus]QGT47835.1 ORF107 [Saltwater crocodilepox virus]QGT48045.1 ORF107 [Saltwater crocodilepox virus]QGT48259.1 ORF107 [Saltwater crocodilepox virus]QGT48475.1 ORF107 [Saltwater crocodilepox virus]